MRSWRRAVKCHRMMYCRMSLFAEMDLNIIPMCTIDDLGLSGVGTLGRIHFVAGVKSAYEDRQ